MSQEVTSKSRKTSCFKTIKRLLPTTWLFKRFRVRDGSREDTINYFLIALFIEKRRCNSLCITLIKYKTIIKTVSPCLLISSSVNPLEVWVCKHMNKHVRAYIELSIHLEYYIYTDNTFKYQQGQLPRMHEAYGPS